MNEITRLKLEVKTQDQLIKRIDALSLALKGLVKHNAMEMILHNADLDQPMTTALKQLKRSGINIQDPNRTLSNWL